MRIFGKRRDTRTRREAETKAPLEHPRDELLVRLQLQFERMPVACIVTDPDLRVLDWNPAAEAQATDRAHRIGQTRVVTSYKLIVSGTVEEKVLAMQDEKRALRAGVFDATDIAAAKLSLSDLKSLLQ